MGVKRIYVNEVDGYICVDFSLSPKRIEGKPRVNEVMRKVMRAFLHIGAVQSHNKTPENTIRLLTDFRKKIQAVHFVKNHGGLPAIRLMQIS